MDRNRERESMEGGQKGIWVEEVGRGGGGLGWYGRWKGGIDGVFSVISLSALVGWRLLDGDDGGWF